MRPPAAAACAAVFGCLLVACLLASAAFVSAQESLAGTVSAVTPLREQHAPARLQSRLVRRGGGARRGSARVRSATSPASGVAKAASASDLATYEREHAALLAIKASMPALDNTTWATLGWSADTNHCTVWKGLKCTPEGDPAGRVTALELYSQNLYGRIPWGAIGELSSVENLWLDDNPRLADADPPNTLDPQLPAKMPGLASFWISYTGLAGSIPESYGSLANLTQFVLSNNRLTGPFPESFGRLTRVKLLTANNNNLTAPASGSFASWAGMSQLQDLNIGGNPLGVTLDAFPWEGWTSLTDLALAAGRLTGSLSPRLAACTALKIMYLYENALSGDLTPAIRAWAGSLNKLQLIAMYNNRFNSVLPPEIARFPALTDLYMGNCGLKGPLPPAFPEKLAVISLGTNALTGPMDPVCGLKSLTSLRLTLNRLTGQLCPELSGATGLQFIQLEYNQLTGPLPAAWGSLRNLQSLWLRENRLSGGLPAAWGPMVATLQFLMLDTNCLRGPVPCSWGNVSTASSVTQALLTFCRNPISEAVCGPSGATLNGCLPYSGIELPPAPGRVSTFCVTRDSTNANLTFIPFNTGTRLTGFCGAPAFSMPTSPAGANSSMVCAESADPANCTSSPLLSAYATGPASGVMATPQNNTGTGTCEAVTNMGAFEVACATSDAGAAALRFNLTIINAQLINRIRFYAGCAPPVAPGGGQAACSQWRPLPANYTRVRGSNGTFDSISWSAPLTAGCDCADAHNSIFIRSGTKCRA